MLPLGQFILWLYSLCSFSVQIMTGILLHAISKMLCKESLIHETFTFVYCILHELFFIFTQAEELRKSLWSKNVPAKVYVGMRYWHPFTEEAIEQVSGLLWFRSLTYLSSWMRCVILMASFHWLSISMTCFMSSLNFLVITSCMKLGLELHP